MAESRPESPGKNTAGVLLNTTVSLLRQLCAGLPSANSQPVAVIGSKLELQAARRDLSAANSTTWWPFVTGGPAANGSQLQPSDDWRQWQRKCGTNPEQPEDDLCQDMCVTRWVAKEDLLAASSDRIQKDMPPRR